MRKTAHISYFEVRHTVTISGPILSSDVHSAEVVDRISRRVVRFTIWRDDIHKKRRLVRRKR